MDWYRFHITLYRQDTMHLTPYQDGCYRRLIDHYMETRAPLPDNDAALARIIGDTQENWVTMASAIVKPFFCHSNGKLHHKRCDEELDYQDERQKHKSEAGKKGAEKRWNNKGIDSSAIADLKQCYSKGVQEEKRREENIKDIYMFDDFWSSYPKTRAGSKDQAQKAYAKAIKREDPKVILEAVKKYAQSDEVAKGFAKGCAAWLNDDRWKSQYKRHDGVTFEQAEKEKEKLEAIYGTISR